MSPCHVNRLFLVTAAIALNFAAQPAFALEPVNPLDQIIVSATRTEQSLGVTGTSVSVLTAEDIKATRKTMLTDVLREVPGVTVVRSGGPGAQTSLFLRGVGGEETVVLVDGVRINDPSTPAGTAHLTDIVTTGIERVEVLRGPQSTLYGSHAIGGVINIITTSGQPGLHAEGLVEGGSFDSWRAAGTVSGGTEAVTGSLTASFYDTDGISAADKDDGNTEKDGYRNWSVLGSVGARLADNVRLDLKGLYNRGRADYDGFPPPLYMFADTQNNSTNTLYSGYAGVTVDALGGAFSNRLAVGYSRTDRADYDADLKTNDTRGQTRRFEYQGTVRAGPATEITFGAETERTKIRNIALGDAAPLRANVDIHSLYAQGQTTLFERLTLTAGARYDDHDTFGDHATFRVAGAYRIEETDTLLRANWGEGFKAPSLYQLYSVYGNEDLDAETSKGWEVGFDQGFVEGRIRVSGTYFQQKLKNQIDYVNCTTGDPMCADGRWGYYDNVARASFKGVELGLLLQPIDPLVIRANYTWLEPLNEVTDTDLARRARDSFQTSVNWAATEKLNFSASLTLTGDSYDSAGEVNRLEGYTLVDLRAGYAILPGLEVYGRVDNVFDADYEVVSGYGTLGRGAFIGLSARY
ncbi:TonB-dependent receptor plug domain-containing protein [Pedomonas mirosovicensis]|uniref:TonB-dependent receptor plug domain-containing protein n=1 Tax=Pedomonas mirosovicensis TaxID=2908641 RepID=UPI00216728BC|nr:TonB-dependent receptor [Pedomonas mirosovicensis]MCH8685729.1 TonB-dependent receptor [Pedomonas mirosovicensis]